MKRWTRSLPVLLAMPFTFAACLASTQLVVSPAMANVILCVGIGLLLAVTFGLPTYLHFHDQEAFDAATGLFMFTAGVSCFIAAYIFPIGGLTSQQYLALHSTIFVCIVGGWTTVNGAGKSSLPKRWLFNIGTWLRQESTTA